MLRILNTIKIFFKKTFFKLKRILINKLGMVSDQYFFLDSYMAEKREDGVERLDIYSPQSEVEFIVPANGRRIKSFF